MRTRALRQPVEERERSACLRTRSILFDRGDDLSAPAGMRSSAARSSGVEAQRLDHEQRHVDVARGLGGAPVERAVQDALRLRSERPGESTNTYWQSGRVRMPVSRCRVVCGLRETIESFWPTRRLSRLDLPVFGRADDADGAAAVRRSSLRASRACAAPPPARRAARSAASRACSGRARARRIRPRRAARAPRPASRARGTRAALLPRLQISCSWVFGVLGDLLRVERLEQRAEQPPATASRAASKPPSRNTAPTAPPARRRGSRRLAPRRSSPSPSADARQARVRAPPRPALPRAPGWRAGATARLPEAAGSGRRARRRRRSRARRRRGTPGARCGWPWLRCVSACSSSAGGEAVAEALLRGPRGARQGARYCSAVARAAKSM